MSSSSAQSCTPGGGRCAAPRGGGRRRCAAETFRATARADKARAIAYCTDAAKGSAALLLDDDDEPPGGGAGDDDDESAVSHALGYGVVWQIAVTFMAVDDGDAVVPIVDETTTTAPSSCFGSVAAGATPVARASSTTTVAMAQGHAARTASSLRISPRPLLSVCSC
jgi:hypothetical protein